MKKSNHGKKRWVNWILIAVAMAVVGAVFANLPKTKIEERIEGIVFDTQITYDDTLREGERIVKQEGKVGKKNAIYEVTYQGDKEIKREEQSSIVVEDPVDQIVIEGTKKYYKCSDGREFEQESEKDECEKRIVWEQTKSASLAACNADTSKTNCWYDEYPGTTVHWTTVSQPTYVAPSTNSGTTRGVTGGTSSNATSGARTGAICMDGTTSNATGRGACSHHGGVRTWLY